MSDDDLMVIIEHYRDLRARHMIGTRKATKQKAPEGKLNLEELDL